MHNLQLVFVFAMILILGFRVQVFFWICEYDM